MLLVETAFNLLLRGNAGVAAIASTRIFNSIAVQTATYPYIVTRTEGRSHVIALDGACGLRESRIRVFSAAKTYDTAKQLDEAVRLAAQGFEGTVTDNTSPSNTLQIQLIECVFSIDNYLSDTKTHEIVTDYLVTAHEEVPD